MISCLGFASKNNPREVVRQRGGREETMLAVHWQLLQLGGQCWVQLALYYCTPILLFSASCIYWQSGGEVCRS